MIHFLFKFFSTAAVGAVSFWAGIPTGYAMGLSLVSSGAATVAGSLGGVVAIVLLGEKLEALLQHRGKTSQRRERLKRIWDRYGIAGVALLAPLLAGAHLGTALALGFGAPPEPLLRWMSLSVVLWGIIFVVAEACGISFFRHLSPFHG